MGLLDSGAPAGKKKGGGGGGKKGKAEKTLDDLMKAAVEKLQTQLKEYDLQNAQLAQLYPIGSKKLALEQESLARKYDQTLTDFQIKGQTEGWYDLLKKQAPEVDKQVTSAIERTKIANSINEEYRKAVEKARENIQQAKRETELRRSVGEKIDETKVGQENLNEAIKFAADHSKTLAEAMGALVLSAQDIQGAFDQLKQAAQEAVSKAQQLKLGWDMSQLDYQAQLAAAREGDPNRDQGIGFNATITAFQRQLEEVARTAPASEQAMELAQSLQQLQIEAEQTATDMREGKMLRGAGAEVVQQNLAQMASDLAAAIQQLNPEGYVEGQLSAAEAQLVAAQDANTGALAATTSALYTLNSTMGGVGGQIASAVSSAMSQVNAAISAAQQAAAPAITAALQGGAVPGTSTATTGAGGG
jgi:hypothetical protein